MKEGFKELLLFTFEFIDLLKIRVSPPRQKDPGIFISSLYLFDWGNNSFKIIKFKILIELKFLID